MPNYDQTKLQALCVSCDKAVNNHPKGEAMADLVQFIFEQVPGVALLERSHKAPDNSAEIDLVFGNRPRQSGLPTSGVTLFVECKNERRRTSSAQVRVFGSKLRDRNQRIGILATRRGLSGKGLRDGHAAVARELQDGRSIVVITWDDVQKLGSTDDLVALCEARLEELEFNGTYKTI